MPEPIRPTPTRPADTRPPSRPGGTPPPSGPTSPTLPRPGRHPILNHLGLVAALAAIAVLMTVGLMSILFGCARTLYWLPSTSDIVGVLLIWLTAVWVVAGLVLAPPRRPRRTDPRAPRSPEWDGVAVRPAAMVGAAGARARVHLRRVRPYFPGGRACRAHPTLTDLEVSMNTRRLAGSRRNKHLPIARRSYDAAEHLGPVLAAALYAATHKPWRKPDHAARAVDIRTIWPPLTVDDSTAKQRLAAEAGARGKSAAPMSDDRRADAYLAQPGVRRMTDRQRRQYQRMGWRNALLHATA